MTNLIVFLLFIFVVPLVRAEPLLELTISQNPYRSLEITRQDPDTKNYFIVVTRVDAIEADPVKYIKFDYAMWVDCRKRIMKPVIVIIDNKVYVSKASWQTLESDATTEPDIWFKYVCP